MSIRTAISLLLMAPAFAQAQTTNDSISVDVLRSPASPAFNILGIAPSVIERPTDLNAFRVSVQNASNNFSKLPSDYAIEIAPANLLHRHNITLDRFDTASFKDLFWQSLSLSTGITHGNRDDRETDDSTSFTKLGIGIKFSILRPGWAANTRAQYQRLHAALAKALTTYEETEQTDTVLGNLKKAAKQIALDATLTTDEKRQQLLGNIEQQKAEKIRLHTAHTEDSTGYIAIHDAVRNFRIDRAGPFLDFAGGIALDFPDNRFDYALTSKAGGWLTGGYENTGSGCSALAIIRYLYQPDKIFADDAGRLGTANISTFDAGARVLLTAGGGKFSASFEGIYRSVLNAKVIAPAWRYTFNTDYDIGLNRKLTLAIGKNFDGVVTKSGNIIAVLNFVAGFGASKKIN